MRKFTVLASVLLCCSVFQATAQSNKFGPANQLGAGINIHFSKGHEQDLDLIAAAGFKYIRMDFEWQGMERTKGVYNWANFDELVGNLKKRGMGAIGILDYSNALYEEESNSKNPQTGKEQRGIASPQHPESIAAFTRWAVAMVEHFKGSNIVWEIWNEPNISFWKPKADVNQYIALALATGKAIKTAVPDARLIGPCTSQIPIAYIEPFMASGVLQYLDAVSVHPYRNYSKSPETAIVEYQKLRELITKYAPEGKKNMPVISSEWGYSTSTKGVSVDVQAAYLVRMQLANLMDGVPISIWYDWKNDGIDPAEHEENFGTVTADLVPKPSYTAMKTMGGQLNDYTYVSRIATANANDYVLVFKNKGNYKLAAWTADAAHALVINNKVAKATAATAVDGTGGEIKPTTEQGKLALQLAALPQYVTLKRGIDLK